MSRDHDRGKTAARRIFPRLAAAAALAWLSAAPVWPQTPGAYYPFDDSTPAGVVGGARLMRGGPIIGYFQPVEIEPPSGASVSLAAEGTFTEPYSGAAEVGLLIGAVYRLRVSELPGYEGIEIFPTIEVIDRVYPPAGQERRFPIPIELTEQDLALAMEGKFVTRVIYVEDPDRALPKAQGEQQEWFDVGPGENPLETADSLGRPVAIVRIGGRLPNDLEYPDYEFLGGCPPFTVFRPYARIDDGADWIPQDEEGYVE